MDCDIIVLSSKSRYDLVASVSSLSSNMRYDLMLHILLELYYLPEDNKTFHDVNTMTFYGFSQVEKKGKSELLCSVSNLLAFLHRG